MAMNTTLQRDADDWRRIGGLDTAEEIAQQPALWRELAQQLESSKGKLQAFLGNWLNGASHRVILTGAGSSAFVGELLADELDRAWPAEVRALSTTSLLTHPDLYLDPRRPTLLVSFARSGNSPESTGVVDLLRQALPAPRFLNITCNPDGALAQQAAGREDSFNLLMPAKSCDRGFAMTSSFSCMLLAARVALGTEGSEHLNVLADCADIALREWATPIAELAAKPFDRIVYLGSGPLEALAKEAALKVLELSSGRALALANTALGFRHGPKSALSKNSLVIFLRSNKPLAQRYEADLIAEIEREQVASECLSVGPASSGAQWSLDAPADYSDTWLAPLWLLAAQMFSLNKSAALGLTPDNPFPDGTVNRVVQGVTIYAD